MSNKFEKPEDPSCKHKSSRASKVCVRRSVKRDRVKKIQSVEKTCVDETELDEYLKSNPTLIAALPFQPKAPAKLAKRKPVGTELGENE